MIAGFFGGAAYAVALWLLAQHVARQRSLALGKTPLATIAACGAAAACLVHAYGTTEALLLGASLIGTSMCALVDARTGLIFDALSRTMMVVALAGGIAAGRSMDGMLAGAVIGGGLWLLYVGTARRGIGLGDVKLGAALSLGFGLRAGVVALASAFVLGAGYGVALLVSGRAKRTDALRFGPFIAGGAIVALAANALGIDP